MQLLQTDAREAAFPAPTCVYRGARELSYDLGIIGIRPVNAATTDSHVEEGSKSNVLGFGR